MMMNNMSEAELIPDKSEESEVVIFKPISEVNVFGGESPEENAVEAKEESYPSSHHDEMSIDFLRGDYESDSSIITD